MADVFISYSQRDRAIAQDLASDLRARGLDVWWDVRLYAGENFGERIRAEITAAKAVVVIWSDASAASQWVQGEASLALRGGKLISTHVPGYDVQQLPVNFLTLHCEPVNNRARVVEAIQRFGARSSPTDQTPAVARVQPDGTPAGVPRRVAVAAAALTLIVMVGGGWYWSQMNALPQRTTLTIGTLPAQTDGTPKPAAALVPPAVTTAPPHADLPVPAIRANLPAPGQRFRLHISVASSSEIVRSIVMLRVRDLVRNATLIVGAKSPADDYDLAVNGSFGTGASTACSAEQTLTLDWELRGRDAGDPLGHDKVSQTVCLTDKTTADAQHFAGEVTAAQLVIQLNKLLNP